MPPLEYLMFDRPPWDLIEFLRYQLKAKLDEGISFRKITHLLEPEIGKLREMGLYRVSQDNCAPFVWLQWGSCRFDLYTVA